MNPRPGLSSACIDQAPAVERCLSSVPSKLLLRVSPSGKSLEVGVLSVGFGCVASTGLDQPLQPSAQASGSDRVWYLCVQQTHGLFRCRWAEDRHSSQRAKIAIWLMAELEGDAVGDPLNHYRGPTRPADLRNLRCPEGWAYAGAYAIGAHPFPSLPLGSDQELIRCAGLGQPRRFGCPCPTFPNTPSPLGWCIATSWQRGTFDALCLEL